MKVSEGAITTSSSSTDKRDAAAAVAAEGQSAASKGHLESGRRKKRRCHSAEMISVRKTTSFSESDTSFGEGRDLLAPRYVDYMLMIPLLEMLIQKSRSEPELSERQVVYL